MQQHDPTGVSSRRALFVAAAVAVGLALRVWEAATSSLWLDELHTLAHASLPTVREVADNVSREYHSPLFFLGVHAFGGWEQGAWLRALPIASSLLVFVPLLAFAGTSQRASRTVPLAAWLFACSPYAVHWSADLRPYAWLMALSAGAAWAAFSEHRSRWLKLATFFACVLVGIFTHRFTAVVVLAIGAARLVVRRPTMLPLTWLIGAGAAAAAPAIPWFVGMAETATQRRLDYQESSGGFRLRWEFVKECAALPLRVFVPFLGALGGAWTLLAQIATAVTGCALLDATSSWLNDRARTTPAPMRALAAFSAAYLLLVSAAAFWTWDRLPLQYYAPLAWALPVLLAEFASRASRTAVAVFAGSVLALGIAQAGGDCTEDVRRAVAVAREQGALVERPLYSALLSQPSLFEQVLPYRAYGRDLEFVAPVEAPRAPDRPLIVIRRGQIALDAEDWQPLLRGRTVAREIRVDAKLTVFVLEPGG